MISLSDCKNYEYSSAAAASVTIVVSIVDLLIQILLRLPVKSLLVFKTVSKQWFSLISDPFFTNKYNILQNSLSIQGLYTQTWAHAAVKKLDYVPLDGSSSSSAPFQTLSFISDSSCLAIIQSCNGLMCCRIYSADDFNIYYICNPSTRQYRPIVCHSRKRVKAFENIASIGIAYNPLKSPHYKVVCIWLLTKPGEENLRYQTDIYSSETASWKLSGEGFSIHGRYYHAGGVFWNGSLHWLVHSSRVFCFNVDTELRMEMEMPAYVKELGMKIDYFGECNGHLYTIFSLESSPTSLEIFEMKTDYSGWNLRYLVNLQELACPRFYYYVLLVRESEGESPKLLLRVRDKAISFDLQDGSFKEIQQVAATPRAFICCARYFNFKQKHVGYPYIQTLASV